MPLVPESVGEEPGGSGVLTASSTPAPAIAMPASCTVVGRSPWMKPTITGTAPESAAVGATMLMRPTASPLYREASPIAPAMPPRPPYTRKRASGRGSPRAITRPAVRINPAVWLTTITVAVGSRFDMSPPTKSAEPHVNPESRARPNGNIRQLGEANGTTATPSFHTCSMRDS